MDNGGSGSGGSAVVLEVPWMLSQLRYPPLFQARKQLLVLLISIDLIYILYFGYIVWAQFQLDAFQLVAGLSAKMELEQSMWLFSVLESISLVALILIEVQGLAAVWVENLLLVSLYSVVKLLELVPCLALALKNPPLFPHLVMSGLRLVLLLPCYIWDLRTLRNWTLNGRPTNNKDSSTNYSSKDIEMTKIQKEIISNNASSPANVNKQSEQQQKRSTITKSPHNNKKSSKKNSKKRSSKEFACQTEAVPVFICTDEGSQTG